MIPYYFERLQNHKIFLSNLLGGWEIIEATPTLEYANAWFDQPSFQRKGFGLNTEQFSRSAVLSLASRYSKNLAKPSLVMVVPTLRCDHNCTYCQVSRASLTSTKHDLMLSPKSIATAIDKIAANSFKLEIQGGEPLLRTSYITALVEELRVSTAKQFEIVITTALGPPLEPAFLDWANQNQISFSISFDGLRSVHEAQRKWIHSDETTHLLKQIEILKSAGFTGRIGLVNTITRELLKQNPDCVIDEITTVLGQTRLFSRPLSNYGFAATTKTALGYELPAYLKFMASYLDAIIAANNRGVDFFDQAFEIYVKTLFRPEETNHVDFMNPSGYALGAVLIYYDGHVFGADEARMMFESTGNPNLPIAKIDQDGSLLLNDLTMHEQIIARSFKESKPHCDICAFSPFCGSDPMHDVLSQGDLQGFMTSSDFCRTTKFFYDTILTRYDEGEISDEMIERWLT